MKRKILVLLLICLVALIISGVLYYRHCDAGIRNAYAKWTLGSVLVSYHKKNSTWPSGWDNLNGHWISGDHPDGWPEKDVRLRIFCNFQQLQDLKNIEIAKSEKVIYSVSPPNWCWEGTDPNMVIYKYLNEIP